jgi:hypothetical protein
VRANNWVREFLALTSAAKRERADKILLRNAAELSNQVTHLEG